MIRKIYLYEQMIINEFEKQKFFERNIYQTIKIEDKITGILGLRGVGKTSFLLKKRINCEKSIYISCDLGFLKGEDFLDIITNLYQNEGITTFFLDEIQSLDNRQSLLKNIYDFLPIKVIFSGSNMINILKGSYDLSRRAIIHHIPTFSFREFLDFSHNINIPQYTLTEILSNHIDIAKKHLSQYNKSILQKYRQIGQFGYRYKESQETYIKKLNNSLKKSLYEDIVQVIDIKSENIASLEKILFFISNSGTSNVSQNSLSRNTGLTTKTIGIYLNYLEQAGRIKRISKYGTLSDTVRKQEKIYLTSTNILNYLSNQDDIKDIIGTIRETFFINTLDMTLKNKDIKCFYLDKTDFVIEDKKNKYFLEIGGKSKKRDDVISIKDDINIGDHNTIPLRIFGLIE